MRDAYAAHELIREVHMTAQHGSRSRCGYLIVACGIPLLFCLHGCESSADPRLANLHEMVRRHQAAPPAPANASAPGIAGEQALPPRAPSPADSAAPSVGAGLPAYPGSSKVGNASDALAGLDDGLSMEMRETRDPVDVVIDFYSKRMVSADDRFKPTRTEDRLDGRRVVRLSLPQPDGGLQTVEAREDAGKTTIQLLNMRGKTSRGIPNSIPGVDPLSPTSARPGPRVRTLDSAPPLDPSISGPPVDIPQQRPSTRP
jgi:hypothetical protein